MAAAPRPSFGAWALLIVMAPMPLQTNYFWLDHRGQFWNLRIACMAGMPACFYRWSIGYYFLTNCKVASAVVSTPVSTHILLALNQSRWRRLHPGVCGPAVPRNAIWGTRGLCGIVGVHKPDGHAQVVWQGEGAVAPQPAHPRQA